MSYAPILSWFAAAACVLALWATTWILFLATIDAMPSAWN